jgi:hypothetical protein
LKVGDTFEEDFGAKKKTKEIYKDITFKSTTLSIKYKQEEKYIHNRGPFYSKYIK